MAGECDSDASCHSILLPTEFRGRPGFNSDAICHVMGSRHWWNGLPPSVLYLLGYLLSPEGVQVPALCISSWEEHCMMAFTGRGQMHVLQGCTTRWFG